MRKQRTKGEGTFARTGRSKDQRAPRAHREEHGRWYAGRIRQRDRCGPVYRRDPTCYDRLQRRYARRQAHYFRMGINLGDVIVEPGDIFGDGVNIAARLEALAEPG